MEACSGAHFLGRALREHGHEVRLMPAQYVKPYVQTNKSDYLDAEAIAEAVQRPRMRFVPSWPGVTDSTEGRIHWRRPTAILRFSLATLRRTIHTD
jgi:transposase